jgi:4-alpha-glucanotransferase
VIQAKSIEANCAATHADRGAVRVNKPPYAPASSAKARKHAANCSAQQRQIAHFGAARANGLLDNALFTGCNRANDEGAHRFGERLSLP